MLNLDLVSSAVGIVIGVSGAVTIAFLVLKSKGVKINEVLEKTKVVLTGVDSIISAADKIIPNNPSINVLKIVDKYAHIGVNQAEQLYIASQLLPEQRNAKARETIYAALNLLKIKRTPEMDRIIDGAIETEVLALGHKEPIEAEKEAEKQALQAQVAQLTTENANLKNAITTAASTVQVTTQTA